MKKSVNCVALLLITLIGVFSLNCKSWGKGLGHEGVPDESELVGKWQLNQRSSKLLQDATYPKLTKVRSEENVIEIKADGSCKFRSYSAFQSDEDYVNANGKWSLRREYSEWFSKEMWIIEFDLEPQPSIFTATFFFLDNRNGSIGFFYYAGDPDLNQIVEFEKS